MRRRLVDRRLTLPSHLRVPTEWIFSTLSLDGNGGGVIEIFCSVQFCAVVVELKEKRAEVDHNFVSRQENISRCGLYFNYSTDFEEDSDDYSIESLTTGFVALFGSEEWRKEVIQID